MAGCSHAESTNSKEHGACECSSGRKAYGLAESIPEMDFQRSLAGAAQLGDVNRMQTLLNRGANVNGDESDAGYAPLHYAARHGHVQACRLLLQHGALIDRTTRAGKSTSLHRAAYVGHLAVVELLLQSGADPLAKDADGYTPLWKAETKGHVDIVEVLKVHLDDAARKFTVKNVDESISQDYYESISQEIYLK